MSDRSTKERRPAPHTNETLCGLLKGLDNNSEDEAKSIYVFYCLQPSGNCAQGPGALLCAAFTYASGDCGRGNRAGSGRFLHPDDVESGQLQQSPPRAGHTKKTVRAASDYCKGHQREAFFAPIAGVLYSSLRSEEHTSELQS